MWTFTFDELKVKTLLDNWKFKLETFKTFWFFFANDTVGFSYFLVLNLLMHAEW